MGSKGMNRESVSAIRAASTTKADQISDADRSGLERPRISGYAYQCPESLAMTSCADQSTRRARAYGMAGSILPDCHKLKYCHLVAQILARLLLPTGARSSALLLPRNRHTIASATGAEFALPTGARSEPYLASAIERQRAFSARRHRSGTGRHLARDARDRAPETA